MHRQSDSQSYKDVDEQHGIPDLRGTPRKGRCLLCRKTFYALNGSDYCGRCWLMRTHEQRKYYSDFDRK